MCVGLSCLSTLNPYFNLKILYLLLTKRNGSSELKTRLYLGLEISPWEELDRPGTVCV